MHFKFYGICILYKNIKCLFGIKITWKLKSIKKNYVFKIVFITLMVDEENSNEIAIKSVVIYELKNELESKLYITPKNKQYESIFNNRAVQVSML